MFALIIGPMAAVALAWALTTKYREHRPTAVLLSLLLGGILAQRALEIAVLVPLRASLGVDHPWTGWAWGVALANHAIALVEPAALVGAALVVFARRRPWGAVAAWIGAVVAYAAVHPLGAAQARFLLVAETVGIVTAAGVATAWWVRSATAVGASAQHAVTAIVMAELLNLPNAAGAIPGWPTAQTLYVLLFGSLIVMQAYATKRDVDACKRRQDVADKAVLRSNLFAESAIRTAEHADITATEARDLAETAFSVKRRPG